MPNEENQAGDPSGHDDQQWPLDLTGGDEFELDNDALPMRADLAFIYDWKA